MRSVLDKLIAWVGILLAVVLLAAGGLLTWANQFIGDQVKEQFGNQEITMPSGGAIDALPNKDDQDALRQFAKDGKNKLDNGPEAKAFADHYILAHMRESGVELLAQVKDAGITEIPGANGAPATPMPTEMNYSNAGKVAGAVTAAADAATQAGNTAEAQKLTDLAGEIGAARTDTFLTGNTLRGLLLYGYAFATMGTIAGIAAIGAYIGGLVMLVLGILGFWHSGRTKPDGSLKS